MAKKTKKILARRGTKGRPRSSRTASKRRVLSVLPKSKATTAFGLLTEIAAVIVAEPKRLSMGDWLVKGSELDRAPLTRPACDTVGCIAGWAVQLKGTGFSLYDKRRSLAPGFFGVAEEAQEIFGLSKDQADHLFYFAPTANEQTAAHARSAVAHIRRFQKTHADQLKAKRLDA